MSSTGGPPGVSRQEALLTQQLRAWLDRAGLAAPWLSSLISAGGGHPNHTYSRVLSHVLDEMCVGPQSLYLCTCMMSECRRDTPLYRFLAFLQSSRREAALSLPNGVRGHRSDSAFALPSHLPMKPVADEPPCGSDDGARTLWLARASSWCLVEWTVALSSYYEIGCPKSSGAARKAMGAWSLSSAQEAYCLDLHERFTHFCLNTPSEPLTRGRRTLLEMLRVFSASTPEVGASFQQCKGPPLEIDPTRVSLPKEAGSCNPEDFLLGRHRREYRNLERLIKPEESWELPLPRPCFMISPENEKVLRERLVQSEMALLIDEAEVPTDSRGRKLLSGMFGVAHKEASDRLIFDRRPQNATEDRLSWSDLPHGTLFCKLVVGPDETVRGSGDDISCFFYCLASPAQWRKRTAFGRAFTGKDAVALGGRADRTYHLALAVWAMGDLNAVDVAQCTHESILRKHSCLRAGESLHYHGAFPEGPVYEGVYVDDHVVVAVCPKDRFHDPHVCQDQERIEAALEGYREARLPVAPEKSFRMQETFVAWGTEVCGKKGTAAAPAGRRLQLIHLVCLALLSPTTTKALMRSLLGALIHPFMHRKCCMAVLGRAYRFTEDLREDTVTRLPADICDELRAALVVLPLAEADIRAPICTDVFCSDATPVGAGTAQARFSRTFVRNLFSFCEHAGEYTRLDWSGMGEVLKPWNRPELPPDVLRCIGAADWRVDREVAYKATSHVNLREAGAVKLVLRHFAEKSNKARRVLNLVDSRVALGAFAKGRSSSAQLNKVLRGSLGYSLLANIHLHQAWIGTEVNPADDPSRGAPLRAPVPAPDLSHWLSAEGEADRDDASRSSARRRLCREIFAGCGRLSAALERAGASVACPMESGAGGTKKYVEADDLGREEVFRRLRREVKRGTYSYLHFGFPRSTFSTLRCLSVGTRSRAAPEGCGRKDEEEGNLLLEKVCTLCWEIYRVGGFFSLENPKSSLLWDMPEVSNLLQVGKIVSFDQCGYGLRVAEQFDLIKRPTSVLSNVPGLEALQRSCDRSHSHMTCWGSAKLCGSTLPVAKLAGLYPPQLCSAWASIVVGALGSTCSVGPVNPGAKGGSKASTEGERCSAGGRLA